MNGSQPVNVWLIRLLVAGVLFSVVRAILCTPLS